MAFVKLTDAETGAERVLNTQYVVYAERDTESAGAVVWWVSYRDPGQPRSRDLVTRETYEDVVGALVAGDA